MMKKVKPTRAAHTSKSQKGMGDFYGTGIRNPVGKIRDVSGLQMVSKAKSKKPPKSLA